MKNLLSVSLPGLLAIATLTGCATIEEPPPAPSTAALPVEVIPSGTGAPLRFEAIEASDLLRIVARADESVTGAHTDIHLVGRSGKAFSVKTATIDLQAGTEHPLAEFPAAETRKASAVRVVYHTDPDQPRDSG